MKKTTLLSSLLMLSVATLALGACDDSGKTEEQAAAPVTVETPAAVVSVAATDATSYATSEGQANGAIFLKLTNNGTTDDTLIGATTSVSPTVELHESTVDTTSGVMKMTKVDSISIPAGQTVELKSGGYHIMLVGLTAPLTAGATYDVTLDFAQGADVIVPVTVVVPTAQKVEAAVDAVQQDAVQAVDAVKETTSEAVDAAKDAGTEAMDATQDMAHDAMDAAKDAGKDAMDATEGAMDTMKDAVAPETDATKSAE